MKKLIIVSILMLVTIGVKAQFFMGGFYSGDPDAWIDKEPYFACKNLYVYNGWGQNLQNISAVINGTDVYSFPNVWLYNSYITIGRENGIDFSSGDKVSLYWGNQCIGTWVYKSESILSELSDMRRPRGGKNTSKMLKSVWKYVKKIRL
ncbi:hypothetical protein [Bacteroides sp.]|uniref:hypothetical protein n=1 Tax=Bacteroides sp. TaxID=29523 RepID=UPI0025903D5D|nr:hypothetical protein [Bacteroides sp.]